MRRNKYILFFSAFIVIVSGCNKTSAVQENTSAQPETIRDYTSEKMVPEDYSVWMKEESSYLEKEDENEKLKFVLRYLPAEYSAMLELQGEKPSPQQWDTLVKNHSEFSVFKLQISATDFNGEFIKQDKPEPTVYEERIKYYSFGMQHDVFAVLPGNDTNYCNMYHFERNYGASPVSTFLIGFDKLTGKDEIKIVIREKVFSNEELVFRFSEKELKNIPQLKLF